MADGEEPAVEKSKTGAETSVIDFPAAKRQNTGLTEQQRGWLTEEQAALRATTYKDVAEFSVTEVQQWVAAALLAGGLEGSIEDVSTDVSEVVAVLKKQKVIGAALVKLTLEELLAAPLSLAFGPAKVLATRITAAALPPQVLELCFVAPPPPHCPRETWDLDRSRRLGGFE